MLEKMICSLGKNKFVSSALASMIIANPTIILAQQPSTYQYQQKQSENNVVDENYKQSLGLSQLKYGINQSNNNHLEVKLSNPSLYTNDVESSSFDLPYSESKFIEVQEAYYIKPRKRKKKIIEVKEEKIIEESKKTVKKKVVEKETTPKKKVVERETTPKEIEEVYEIKPREQRQVPSYSPTRNEQPSYLTNPNKLNNFDKSPSYQPPTEGKSHTLDWILLGSGVVATVIGLSMSDDVTCGGGIEHVECGPAPTAILGYFIIMGGVGVGGYGAYSLLKN